MSAGRRFLRLMGFLLLLSLVLYVCVLVSGKLTKRTRVRVEYTDIVRRYAEEYVLEPSYVAAVIMAESSYNPKAVSSADARGLMQLLPETAQWIAKKVGETYVEENLFDPAVNVRYGCWYLSFLLDRYENDKRCASAAYHAGQRTVDGWLKDARYSADGRTLYAMGGSATERYVNRIMEYYERYREIYAEN